MNMITKFSLFGRSALVFLNVCLCILATSPSAQEMFDVTNNRTFSLFRQSDPLVVAYSPITEVGDSVECGNGLIPAKFDYAANLSEIGELKAPVGFFFAPRTPLMSRSEEREFLKREESKVLLQIELEVLGCALGQYFRAAEVNMKRQGHFGLYDFLETEARFLEGGEENDISVSEEFWLGGELPVRSRSNKAWRRVSDPSLAPTLMTMHVNLAEQIYHYEDQQYQVSPQLGLTLYFSVAPPS